MNILAFYELNFCCEMHINAIKLVYNVKEEKSSKLHKTKQNELLK